MDTVKKKEIECKNMGYNSTSFIGVLDGRKMEFVSDTEYYEMLREKEEDEDELIERMEEDLKSYHPIETVEVDPSMIRHGGQLRYDSRNICEKYID